jgi:hypothetical protein
MNVEIYSHCDNGIVEFAHDLRCSPKYPQPCIRTQNYNAWLTSQKLPSRAVSPRVNSYSRSQDDVNAYLLSVLLGLLFASPTPHLPAAPFNRPPTPSFPHPAAE